MEVELVEWQKFDDDGLVMPWFTHDCLDEMKRMDLKDKNVVMFGAGMGDAWLSRRCNKLIIIERNDQWLMKAAEYSMINGCNNIQYLHRPCSEGEYAKFDYYSELPEGFIPDVVINDDIMRYEVILMALKLPRPLLLIIDNYQQDYVFLCPSADVALEGVERKIFPQKEHTNHEGNCWKTAIFYIK